MITVERLQHPQKMIKPTWMKKNNIVEKSKGQLIINHFTKSDITLQLFYSLSHFSESDSVWGIINQ